MIKLLSLVLALAAPVAVSAQGIVTTCNTYVFACGSDIYQCGANLTHPQFTATPDACDHGTPGYRPMPSGECTRLIAAVQNANYTSTTRFDSLRCRELNQGNTLTNWGCYNDNANLIMNARDTSQRSCNKTRSYFTMVDPLLDLNQKCGCGPTGSMNNCSFVEPGFQCLPGMRCVATSSNPPRSQCMRDPMADHTCCHSLNYQGPDVAPGTCCLGGRASNGQCVAGREFKNVTHRGICPSPPGADVIRKQQVMVGNVCLQTPDKAIPRVTEHQGDCMIGMRCQGSNNYGFCEWWNKPEFSNRTVNMDVNAQGCEPGDCRVGTYCHRTWRDNGDVQFSQCRALNPGMADTEAHDGLLTNPASNRIYKQKLGRCTGVVGTVWGDPHIITYDKLNYDCMGAGDHVYTENCLFRLHGRLDGMESRRMMVSQTKAMAIQTGHATPNNSSDDSLLQMYFPEKWDLNKTNITAGAFQVYNGDCPVRILLNGAVLPKPQTGSNGKMLSGVVYVSNSVLTITTLVEGSNYFYVVDYANGGTAKFRISGSGGTMNGCVMSVDLCLPKMDGDCYKDSIGLMGTPDADRRNDWMLKTNNTVVTVPVTVNQVDNWNYCSKNWCIKDGTSILPVSNKNVSAVFSENWYKTECDRPYPGAVNYTFCYAIERCDQFLLKYKDIIKGVTPQDKLPPEYISCCIECLGGADTPQCKGEESIIKEIKVNSVVVPDGLGPIVVPPAVTCSNLGTDLSGPTGVNAWPEASQLNVQCADTIKPCVGFDDSWSVFVGGDLTVKRGEAIEGRTYVGGKFTTLATPEPNDSLKYMGWAPCGSQMCPHTMKTALEVCGNINLAYGPDEKIDILMMDDMSGFVRFGGTFMENGKSLPAKEVGSVILVNTTKMQSKGMISQANAEERNAMCFKKTQTLDPLKGKSTYWASQAFKTNNIFLTGTVTVDELAREIVLNGPVIGNGCTILIDINGSILNRGTPELGWKIIFGDKISASQTVLINVSGQTINIQGIAVMEDKLIDGTVVSGYNFDNKIMTKTLWNFFEATSVSFGSPTSASSLEWQGSILAPLANVNFAIKSHLGRLVVGGSLTVDHPDAIFYNYMFNPKGGNCELPQTPQDTCVPVAPSPPIPGLTPLCLTDTYLATDIGSTVCLSRGYADSIIRMDGSLGYDGSQYSNGAGIFYGLKLSPDGSSVQFNVNNPFSSNADIYVKHEKFFGGTTWLDPVCEATFQQPHCQLTPFQQDDSRHFEVSCAAHGTTGKKYAQVYVYFATTAPEVKNFTGTKLDGVDSCCHPSEYDETYKFVEFMFKIDCACPTGVSGAATRKLRGN